MTTEPQGEPAIHYLLQELSVEDEEIVQKQHRLFWKKETRIPLNQITSSQIVRQSHKALIIGGSLLILAGAALTAVETGVGVLSAILGASLIAIWWATRSVALDVHSANGHIEFKVSVWQQKRVEDFIIGLRNLIKERGSQRNPA